MCDSCVIVLLKDLERLDGNFSSLSLQLTNLNASSMAWAQLVSLNESIEDVAVSLNTQAKHSLPSLECEFGVKHDDELIIVFHDGDE